MLHRSIAIAGAFGLAVLLAGPARATPEDQVAFERYLIVFGDALLTRPIAFGAAVAGAGVFTATLPFTVGADPGTAFRVLVREPAAFAFTRCMGCGYGERSRSAP